jgi:hypothetical protein
MVFRRLFGLIFPFAEQEFDRSWRQREFLWRFSTRASQYKRTRSAVPRSTISCAGGPSWEASSVLSPHANDTKTSGLPWLGISDRAEIMAAWLDRGSCRDRFRLRRVSRLFRRNSRPCHAAISNPFSINSPAPITPRGARLAPLLLKSRRVFSPCPGIKKHCGILGTARLNDWNRSPNSR